MSETSETHRRLLNMVVRGRLESSNDATEMQTHTVSLLAREAKGNVERFQQYGITTNPMPGSEVLVVFPNGNREHGIIIAIENRASRLPRMAPGEVSLYSDEGDAISLRRGNCVQIITKTLDVAAGTQVVITTGGPVKLTASGEVAVTAPTTTLKSQVTIQGDLHVAAGGTERAGGGTIMTDGPITLPGNASGALQAVPKQQLDAAIAGVGGGGGTPVPGPPGPPGPTAVSTDTPNMAKLGSDSLLFVRDAASDGKAYGRVNAAWAQVLPIAGGTLTGPLTLSGLPTLNGHAASKQYVDQQDALRLALAGGTMTGALTLSAAPTVALHAATKAYVDSQITALPQMGNSQWDKGIMREGEDEPPPDMLATLAARVAELEARLAELSGGRP